MRIKMVIATLALAATSLVWSGGTFSAFNRTSGMPNNSVVAGSVTIADNDSGTAMISLPSATPGSSATGCAVITYSGTTAAGVRLFGTISGTGLASYLTLTITRGTISGTPAPGSCTGFTPDSGGGSLYSGALSAFPVSSGTALTDATSWTAGSRRAYRLVLTLPAGATAAAQGLTATTTFTWQAVSS